MCVRTKVDYGCGHAYRTTVECASPDCSGLDKYLISKDGDCKTCKREGSSSMRGRHGYGRYGQEIRERERSRSTSYAQASRASSVESAARETTLITSPHDAGVSPWAKPLIREKPWESPHRKQADEAWLSEHENRISDLQQRLEDVHVSQHYVPETPRHRQYESEEDEDRHIEEDPRYRSTRTRTAHIVEESPAARKCTSDIRRRLDDAPSQHSRSGSYPQEVRQYSYDSLPDSMPSYSSSPRHKTQSTSRYAYNENHDYEYYTGNSTTNTIGKRSSGRARTEPYTYSRSSPGYDYDSNSQQAHLTGAGDTVYSYRMPKYHTPHRSIGYRYKPVYPPIAPPYIRYQTRY